MTKRFGLNVVKGVGLQVVVHPVIPSLPVSSPCRRYKKSSDLHKVDEQMQSHCKEEVPKYISDDLASYLTSLLTLTYLPNFGRFP